MSAAGERPGRDEIMALVDGHLDPARRREIEELVRADASLAREVESLAAQRAALHAAYDPVLQEPIPMGMLPRATTARSALARLAVAAALLLVGAAFGSVATREYLSRPRFRKSVETVARGEAPSFVRQATVAYAAFAPDRARPVEIKAEQQDQLVEWLSKRLGRKLRAPFLDDRGIALVGGRLLPGEMNRPAAQFMYEARGGQRLTLFIRAMTEPVGDTAFKIMEEGGVTTFYWVDRDWGYALSGPLSRGELLDGANAVYGQVAESE
jgi:anti-sigma factor RsiW